MADRDGPLAGLKVLDLTEHMAGPFCTMILADMGAEVIKLERPGKGDSVRAWGDGSERNPYFRYINRNKKGITLDYKQPEGKALFLRLVEGIDVLVENYRPNVMPRAGLGFEDLHQVNPRLIYAQLSGLGYDGPYAGRGGFDLIAQGMGGIMHVTGEPDGPPTSVGLPICDLGTGMWAVQGILAALYERQRTGKGRLVECSLLETAIGFSSWTSAQWLADHRGADPPRLAPSPERALSAHEDKGRLSDDRRRRRGDLAALRRRPRPSGMVRGPALCDQRRADEEPCEALEAEMEDGVCDRHDRALGRRARSGRRALRTGLQLPRRCSPTRRSSTAASSNMRATPELGEVPHIRTPIKIGDDVRVRTVAPKLGQHNAEIFGALGVTEAALEKLRAKRIV